MPACAGKQRLIAGPQNFEAPALSNGGPGISIDGVGLTPKGVTKTEPRFVGRFPYGDATSTKPQLSRFTGSPPSGHAQCRRRDPTRPVRRPPWGFQTAVTRVTELNEKDVMKQGENRARRILRTAQPDALISHLYCFRRRCLHHPSIFPSFTSTADPSARNTDAGLSLLRNWNSGP